MIDTSDGLSTDLQHICDESGTGAALYAEALPRLAGDEGLRNALHGGEDYELLFTAPPGRRVPSSAAGVPITRIGEITRQPGIRLFQADGSSRPLQSAGWEHFARQKLPRSSD
jgi:thiamine-monophosphate kinase